MSSTKFVMGVVGAASVSTLRSIRNALILFLFLGEPLPAYLLVFGALSTVFVEQGMNTKILVDSTPA